MHVGGPPAVDVAAEGDEDDLLATAQLAFANDPFLRWLYPTPRAYLEHGGAFLAALAARPYELGTAYCLSDHRGVACWLPPSARSHDRPMMALVRSTLSPTKLTELLTVYERLEPFAPESPHWMLRLVGLDPTRQGRGHGTRLLEPVLAECDQRGVPAFLRSTNPRNLPFYLRQHFEVLDEVTVGSVPTFYPMVRRPQP